MTDLIIIGGSNGFLEVMGIIDDINDVKETYWVVGILDDNPELQGKTIRGISVLGTIQDARLYEHSRFVFAIGSMNTQKFRSSIVQSAGLPANRFETIIHPTAIIDKTAAIESGCIIHPRVFIGNDVCVKKFVVIAVGSTLGPFVTVEEHAMVTSHVVVLSGATVGSAAFVGSMSCVLEGVKIGEYARIGAGSVVSKNIPAQILAIGNPVRFLGLY